MSGKDQDNIIVVGQTNKHWTGLNILACTFQHQEPQAPLDPIITTKKSARKRICHVCVCVHDMSTITSQAENEGDVGEN